jgi:hypothetical protein
MKSTGFTLERKVPDKNHPGDHAEVGNAAAIEADRDLVECFIMSWT